jgi:hypothetical protein
LLVEVAVHVLLSLVEDGFLEAWVQGFLAHGFVVGVGLFIAGGRVALRQYRYRQCI